MRKKLKRLLLSERGDSSYISSFIYILVAVVLIAFIINVFHIISTKQEMDHIADQLVKQIQLNLQPDKRCGRAYLPGIRPRQHGTHPDRDAFLRHGDGALLPGRLLEVQPCAHQRPLTGGRRQ